MLLVPGDQLCDVADAGEPEAADVSGSRRVYGTAGERLRVQRMRWTAWSHRGYLQDR